MRLEFTGRHVTITPTLRSAVERRLARLARKLHDSIVSVQIVLTREDARLRAEATLHARGDRFLHGEWTSRSAKAALDGALAKIEHQAEKLKGKWAERRKSRPQVPRAVVTERRDRTGDGLDRASRIIRVRRYAVKPMSIDDAALELEGGAAPVLVFRNAGTDTVNVLFRRPDGHLGLIEPEE
jgi:putative sigma-54 modulation protein